VQHTACDAQHNEEPANELLGTKRARAML
jgi:hypothetical protein